MDNFKIVAREKLKELYENYVETKELDFDELLTAKLHYSFMGAMDMYEAIFNETVYHRDSTKELIYEPKKEVE